MSAALDSKTRIEALIAAANSKTGGGAADLTAAVQALCDGFSGIRKMQFTVTLLEDSLYLPLDGLTEIPEILQITPYDEAMLTATSGLGSTATPLTGKIAYLTVPILPIKLVGYSSSTIVRFPANTTRYLSSAGGYDTGYGTDVVGTYELNRNAGGAVGITQPANITDTQCQTAFRATVKAQNYALDTDGTLCIGKSASGAERYYGAGVEYLVTALYDVIPSTANGYVTLDRTVNATNVTATV